MVVIIPGRAFHWRSASRNRGVEAAVKRREGQTEIQRRVRCTQQDYQWVPLSGCNNAVTIVTTVNFWLTAAYPPQGNWRNEGGNRRVEQSRWGSCAEAGSTFKTVSISVVRARGLTQNIAQRERNRAHTNGGWNKRRYISHANLNTMVTKTNHLFSSAKRRRVK